MNINEIIETANREANELTERMNAIFDVITGNQVTNRIFKDPYSADVINEAILVMIAQYTIGYGYYGQTFVESSYAVLNNFILKLNQDQQ